MLEPTNYNFCKEFYRVEKVVEVVVAIGGENQQIRIEALYYPEDECYKTRAYRKKFVTIQPTYPQEDEKYVQAPENMQIWVNYDLPWTRRDTAESAIACALGFLEERCGK